MSAAGYMVERGNPRYLFALWPDYRHAPLYIPLDQEDASSAPVVATLLEEAAE